MTDNVPQGVVVVLMANDGRVWGQGSDFEVGGAGGVSKIQNQTRRAKIKCIHDFIKRSCIPDVADCTSSYDAEQLVNDLIVKKKWRFQTIEVGYDE